MRKTLAAIFALMLSAGLSLASTSEPEARIKANSEKGQNYPALRGRWDQKALRPAARFNLDENLSMNVLDALEKDAELKDRAMKLRITAKEGKVTADGVVNDAVERSLVAKKIRAVKGVKSLRNNLRIKKSNKDLL